MIASDDEDNDHTEEPPPKTQKHDTTVESAQVRFLKSQIDSLTNANARMRKDNELLDEFRCTRVFRPYKTHVDHNVQIKNVRR